MTNQSLRSFRVSLPLQLVKIRSTMLCSLRSVRGLNKETSPLFPGLGRMPDTPVTPTPIDDRLTPTHRIVYDSTSESTRPFFQAVEELGDNTPRMDALDHDEDRPPGPAATGLDVDNVSRR